jgi:tetratricopeptide (TPR) repeat protein
MKEEDKEASYERTRQRMKEYRQRMGLEVESEVEHAGEIDNALKIAKVAMAKGIYNTAVSALEKVTAWCSSNSKVGSKVFLELAMAYEAVGRADEAMQVYRNLANCRIGEVRENAKRLLYGLESFEFMKSDAQLASFNRKKIRNTFIETTGIDRFAMNFDDVYNTAYVDTSSREYKKLTENVVRSVREARQILLKATDSGIVERTKIVQALRSLARRFDEALREEKKAAELARQPVPMMDGRPIVSSANRQDNSAVDFHLADPEQMIENLNGEWRLQLIADRTGDGVKYYNTTLSWQQVDTNGMQFSSQGQVGFLTISEAGYLEFEGENRILRRSDISTTGGGSVLAGLLRNQGGASSSGVAQQVITVDSILLVTRCAEMARWQDEERDHFAVWRRVEPGTYSKR